MFHINVSRKIRIASGFRNFIHRCSSHVFWGLLPGESCGNTDALQLKLNPTRV